MPVFVAVVLILIHLAVVGLSVYQKPREMGIALAVIFVGIPVYWFGVAWQLKPKTLQALLGKPSEIRTSLQQIRCVLFGIYLSVKGDG